MSTTQAKADAATMGALGAGGIAWMDMLHGILEWGILILGFLSGCFALYWNVRRWRNEMKARRSDDQVRREYDQESN